MEAMALIKIDGLPINSMVDLSMAQSSSTEESSSAKSFDWSPMLASVASWTPNL